MLVGAIGQGENPTDQEANDALLTLNEIVDKWNIESLMIPCNKNITISLSGKNKYTFGTGGDFNYNLQMGIFDAYYIYDNINDNISIPVKILKQNQYNSLELKDFKNDIVEYIYLNNSYPLSELFVYPISEKGKLVLNVSERFDTFKTLDEVIDLPSGYIKALRYNLAVELSIEYGRQIDPKAEALAVSAKSSIKSTNGNNKINIMKVDLALRLNNNRYSIYTGE